MRPLSWVKLDTGLLGQLRPLERRYGEHDALSHYIRLVLAAASRRRPFDLADEYDVEVLLDALRFDNEDELLEFLFVCAKADLVDKETFVQERQIVVFEVAEAVAFQKAHSRGGRAGMASRWHGSESEDEGQGR